MTNLPAFLRRHRRIALDTSVLIYQLEANPKYASFTDRVFGWIARTDNMAVTSTITMTELLVQPYRDSSELLLNLFYGLLSTFPNLQWLAPDLDIAAMAAKLRAAHRLRAPDALQAATAVRAQATGLVTNDGVFRRVDSFETLVLDDLL